jgi:Sulfotransferase domain
MRYIFCAGMYRACSTWQYDVVCHLVEKRSNGIRLGFLEGEGFRKVWGGNPLSLVGVLKTHDAHDAFAEALALNRATAVYAHRDPRDVVFSWMHKSGLGFDEVVKRGFLKLLLDNDEFWRSRPRVLCQQYERLVGDPVSGILELGAHLGLSLDWGEAEEVAAENSWSANRERTEELKRKALAAGLDLEDRSHTFMHDPVTLLHWNHLRGQRPKSWRELADRAEREVLAAHFGDWLVQNGYEDDTAWVNAAESQSASTLGEQERRRSKAARVKSLRSWSRLGRWFAQVCPRSLGI